MATLVTLLDPCLEQCLALMAGPPNTLAGFLMNQVLAASAPRPLEDDLLFFPGVVGDDGCILLICLDNGGAALAAGDDLLFGSLGRVPGALGAAHVLAAWAFFGRGECRVTLVACPSYTHADRLVHAEDGVVECRGGLPFRGLYLETKSFAQLLGALLQHLGLGELGDTLHGLVAGSGLGGLLLRRGFTIE